MDESSWPALSACASIVLMPIPLPRCIGHSVPSDVLLVEYVRANVKSVLAFWTPLASISPWPAVWPVATAKILYPRMHQEHMVGSWTHRAPSFYRTQCRSAVEKSAYVNSHGIRIPHGRLARCRALWVVVCREAWKATVASVSIPGLDARSGDCETKSDTAWEKARHRNPSYDKSGAWHGRIAQTQQCRLQC